MNVTCPQCATIFRVDPAKVPERGIRARCSVCSGLIAVRRPVSETLGFTGDASSGHPVVVAPPAVVAQRSAPAPSLPSTGFRVAPPPTPVPAAPAPAAPAAPVAPVPTPVLVAPEPFRAPAPAVVATAAVAAPKAPPRFSNPFLQQDPSTRARRLARALVSDLVVYYPEKRQRGLQEGNLKELFAEEIRKSWQEYSEQIGEEFASATPYFNEALNEILAEGKPLFG